MDAIAWGLPVLLVLLICPLMMVGMGVAAWIGVRFLGRSGSQSGHGSHQMCGPMMMGHGGHGAHRASEDDEVSALRARLEDLERQLSGTPAPGGTGDGSH